VGKMRKCDAEITLDEVRREGNAVARRAVASAADFGFGCKACSCGNTGWRNAMARTKASTVIGPALQDSVLLRVALHARNRGRATDVDFLTVIQVIEADGRRRWCRRSRALRLTQAWPR